MDERKGDWMQIFTGKKFWPLDPKSEEVDIKDIALSLAFQCRFNGHSNYFYSIAQHSVIVSKIVSKDQASAALLHDAAETYIGDMVSPLKRFMLEFKEIENKIEKIIFEKFGIKNVNQKEIKRADNIALVTEMRDLMKSPPERWKVASFEPIHEKIISMGPEESEKIFLKRFEELFSNNNF
ncbi:phosphohydrolase [Candidatus Pacearchaeota archaeon CG_4_10_14_0_2_um_filter_30_11]|nr:MAG: phosphohydrolase [Candidatus Pacearchaeota archaeon CG_4_10_14_0_2_um_filter_30_11]